MKNLFSYYTDFSIQKIKMSKEKNDNIKFHWKLIEIYYYIHDINLNKVNIKKKKQEKMLLDNSLEN
jgi:hypothetical protein